MDIDSSDLQGNGYSSTSDAVKVPESLLRRDQARLEELERRKETKESQSATGERSEFFSSSFSSERAAIEELLAGCSPPGTDRASATQTLEEVTIKIQQLQKFLNDSMAFLTQYDLRRAQTSLQELQSSLAEKRDEVLPKKKFAFRSRNAGAGKAQNGAPVPGSLAPSPAAVSAGPGSKVDGIITTNPNQCGFSHADSQTLTKSREEIQKQDVLLTHLTNCKVRLLGAPSTLHIKHVRDCEILCGPVSSSVFVDHCTNSTLSFACQQLRTHNTTDTQVYLHVTSRAIIEDCRGVGFAPFSWTYPGLDQDFSVSGLDQNLNNWTQVDDFNWLAAGTPSPNWTLISEPDRRTSWDA